ncbi:SDR family oxidoreductase [Guptibacillus sedimenti]|uniref:SDR family oxidoreductase n=1 Tax=Guptibacillus sedimenti TaxID=3025680 RepID=UPI00235EF3A0|nr:SDR family oxidoreductase [Pseudalkalibacillus sedimenti]
MAIKNKVVVITGASSGIGEATAKLLARKGAKVVLGARREENLKKISSDILEEGGESVYRVTDVTNPEDNQKLVELAKEQFGKIDAIFLNAGIMPNSPFSALKVDEWNDMIDINIKGVLNGIAAVLPTFKEQKSGHVLATSSVAGLKFYPGGGVYGATKWALKNMMEVLRMESAMEGSNIRTATLYPAAINTELLESITDEDTLSGATEMYEEYGIASDRVANVVAFAIDQPEDTNINEFTVGPTTQPW